MPNPYFQFKQFTVWQDKCAMKVGTDGVLLGAWADVANVSSVLDVGTGTGLVSLMIAQRCQAKITAVEIDGDAALQAKENILHSPWAGRIEVLQGNFINFAPAGKFGLIVSNPPYFIDSLQSPDRQRAMARHAEDLTYRELIGKARALLLENGRFSLIIPADVANSVKALAEQNGLFLLKQTLVATKPGALPKRALLSFGLCETKLEENQLLIELSRRQYSSEYIELTKEYYLNM